MIFMVPEMLEASLERAPELLVESLALLYLVLNTIIFVEKDVLLLAEVFHCTQWLEWILLWRVLASDGRWCLACLGALISAESTRLRVAQRVDCSMSRSSLGESLSEGLSQAASWILRSAIPAHTGRLGQRQALASSEGCLCLGTHGTFKNQLGLLIWSKMRMMLMAIIKRIRGPSSATDHRDLT